jgi:hypothetical protein
VVIRHENSILSTCAAVSGIAGPHAIGQSVAEGSLTVPISPSAAGVNCSPAPCVLPATLASEGTSADIYAPVAVNPRNPAQLIVGSDDGNCGHDTRVGFHVSSDAGSTWSTTCLLGLSAFGLGFQPGDLPLVRYDLNGAAYIAAYYQTPPGPLQPSLIGIEKSTDGVTWSAPTVALGNGSSGIVYASLAVDQMQSSPYANSIYVLGINFAGPTQVLVSRSRDGGNTWTTAQLATTPNADEYNPSLTIGMDGALYAALMRCTFNEQGFLCANDTDYMVFSKSSDGGVTWSHPKLVRSVHEVPDSCGCFPFGTIPNTTVYASNTPALAVDNSSGPYSGRLYITMFEWTGTYMRVLVIHSSDGGNTWSKPVPVAPARETHDQFFPWISVSPTGLVGVSWFDRRNDPANIDYQAYAAISTNGGESFQQNVQLTTASSNPDNNGYDGTLGRYAGNTWDGPNYFIAAWMDTSNGISSQDYVGGIRLH